MTMAERSEHNVISLLARTVEHHGARTALVMQDGKREESVTFAQLWDRVDRTSVGLREAGLRCHERVIVMVPMSVQLYVLLLGVLKLGASAVFVDPWVGRRQIAAFAAFARAAAWIGIPKSHLLRLSDSALRSIPIAVSSGRRWLGLCGQHTLDGLQRRPGDGWIEPVLPDATAMITFTSGSSGIPKGVNRTHEFLMAQHAALQQEFVQRADDVDMPMFPVFALNNLAAGIPSIVPTMDFRHVDRVDGQVITGQIQRHSITTCTASPPFLDRLAVHQTRAPSDRVALRRILTGGAPVTDRQLAAWKEVWPETEVTVVYGSTEAEPVCHIQAEERLQLQSEHATSGFCIGQPSPQAAVRIVRIHAGPIELDERGWTPWDVRTGHSGELVVHGKHVAQSYFQNPDATRENKIVDHQGVVWHRMGDTGYFDADGYLWLVGRVHSTIYRDGQPVHPQLVEQAAVVGCSDVRRVAAVGLPDKELGERVVVVVETSADTDLLERVRACVERAGHVVDETHIASKPLPLDPRHRAKIDYPALRERLLRHGP